MSHVASLTSFGTSVSPCATPMSTSSGNTFTSGICSSSVTGFRKMRITNIKNQKIPPPTRTIKKIPVLDALPNLNHRRPRQQHRIKKHLQRQRQHINHQHRRAPRPRQIRLIARLHAPQQPLRRQLQLPQPRRYPHRHRHGPDLAVVRRRGRVQRPPLLQRQPMPRGVLPLVLHELLNRGPPEVIIPLHAIVNRLDKVVRP
mmetsp:Transcript_16773/g.43198  ORF Transcript_16773/g.43198 Transcript_16773/m.43198 type:complete len:201 (-) Transcript_16773:200-802(-)